MSKISFEKKKNAIFIVNRLSYPEAVNERVFNAIASGMFEGFLPVDIIRKRKYIKLKCTITGLMPLNTYFSGIISKKMFLDVILQLIKLIKSCESNMINPGNLDFQADRIFVDPHTKAITCIYWPIVNNQNSVPAYLFMKQLPHEVVFNEHEEREYINKYLSFFAGFNPFSINNFEKLILTLQGKQSSNTHSPSRQIGRSIEVKKKSDTKQTNVSIEYDPFSQMREEPERVIKKYADGYTYCDNCGARNRIGSNSCYKCRIKLKQNPGSVEDRRHEMKSVPNPNGGTTVLGVGPGDVTVFGYDTPGKPTYPYLIREKTGEKIYIDKPSFRIGKEEGCCDYFVRDNNAVSRNHADIITRGSRYFIIDRHSTNKTYIDGRVIPFEKEMEIYSKTRLRLANEDFTFYV